MIGTFFLSDLFRY